ncbi:MAG: hypothetical protein CVU54_14295 [Deltaproteobacteria bacterium HGW-Deltaproteobacteria-12]|nr:MAG: hypothetical protein CVU54_14295 [Deltaproteobacteria bacterium HGW-Deltaproteobacteria-12]
MHCCVAVGFTSLPLSWGLMLIQPKSITVAKTTGSNSHVVGVDFSVGINWLLRIITVLQGNVIHRFMGLAEE